MTRCRRWALLSLAAALVMPGCMTGKRHHPEAAPAYLLPREPAIDYLSIYLRACDRLRENGLGVPMTLRFVDGNDTTIAQIPGIDHSKDRSVLQFITDHDSTYVASRDSSYVFWANGDTLEAERTRCLQSLLREVPTWKPAKTESLESEDEPAYIYRTKK